MYREQSILSAMDHTLRVRHGPLCPKIFWIIQTFLLCLDIKNWNFAMNNGANIKIHYRSKIKPRAMINLWPRYKIKCESICYFLSSWNNKKRGFWGTKGNTSDQLPCQSAPHVWTASSNINNFSKLSVTIFTNYIFVVISGTKILKFKNI